MGSLPGLIRKRTLKVQADCAKRCSRETTMSFENGLKTIVVATDLEGQAEAALEYARKLADELWGADCAGARARSDGVCRGGCGSRQRC